MFGLRKEEEVVEESRVELAKNKLILSKFLSTLLLSLPLNPNRPYILSLQNNNNNDTII